MSPADRPSFPRLKFALILGGVVALAVVLSGVASRASESARLAQWTAAQALPVVAVVSPGSAGGARALELPGRLEAIARAPIYARVGGYLRSWTYDIGAAVKAGALLAELDTPDLDQQLLQARADLATAEANAALARTTAQRWQKVVQSGAVARQDADEKQGDLAAKESMVKAARANVERLSALKGYARLTAPFDGVVTARSVDVGALVNAGSAAGQELFVVSDLRRLRIYVNVPQSLVPSVPAGTTAEIVVPDHPNAPLTAKISASAQAVNAATGTTLMQLEVDNPEGLLLPGGYATVRLALQVDPNALSIPASALIFDAKGLAVAVVDAEHKVHLKPVRITRDLGKSVLIGSGLDAADRVIESPPDGLTEGAAVRLAGEDSATKGKPEP